VLNQTDVRKHVTNEVRTLLEEAFAEPTELHDEDNLILLGLNSLMLARLVVALERALDVDPFQDGRARVTDLRTIGDVVRIYSTPRPLQA
jgi:acyl carrier protein